MIQLAFESTGKIVPEWENEQERLVFRLSPASVSSSRLLHGQMEEAGALGMVATRYESDIARQVRIVLELPDETWDALADQADDLLEQDSGG